MEGRSGKRGGEEMANEDTGSKERETKSEKKNMDREKRKKKDIEDNRSYGVRSLSSHVRFPFIYSIQGLSYVFLKYVPRAFCTLQMR